MNRILENIKQLAINEGVAITRLEQVIGASKGVLSRAIANKSDIQAKWIVKIIENYPKYSCDWLIKNEGSMIKSSVANLESTATHEISYKDLAESRKEAIESLKKDLAESRKETIESLKKEILYLEQKIALFEKG